MSIKLIELLKINYYDIEMHRDFRGLIKLLNINLEILKYQENLI